MRQSGSECLRRTGRVSASTGQRCSSLSRDSVARPPLRSPCPHSPCRLRLLAAHPPTHTTPPPTASCHTARSHFWKAFGGLLSYNLNDEILARSADRQHSAIVRSSQVQRSSPMTGITSGLVIIGFFRSPSNKTMTLHLGLF